MAKKKPDPAIREYLAEIGRRGGEAKVAKGFAKMPKTQLLAVASQGGKAGAIETPCPRCGKLQPSARAAWMHCRKPRKKAAAKKKGG